DKVIDTVIETIGLAFALHDSILSQPGECRNLFIRQLTQAVFRRNHKTPPYICRTRAENK
ncbi:MAG: hypothetical protein ABIG34_00180, partial [Candidatus Peregrinibacteria bacterium]